MGHHSLRTMTQSLPIYIHYGCYHIVNLDENWVSLRLVDFPFIALNTYINIERFITFRMDPTSGTISVDEFPHKRFSLHPRFGQIATTLREIFEALFPKEPHNPYIWRASYEDIVVGEDGLYFVNPTRSDLVFPSL